jgi:hypothetical protein
MYIGNYLGLRAGAGVIWGENIKIGRARRGKCERKRRKNRR